MKKIPAFKLIPQPMDTEASKLPKFKLAGDDIGTRHQLGGKPNYLQQEDWPLCPDCKEQMSFYAQLDSINDEFNLVDCGMLYVFVCFECNTTNTFIQSY